MFLQMASFDGILCEEDQEFPWDAYEDPLVWWREVNGYVPSKECYDERGDVLPEVTTEDFNAYLKEKRDWGKAHPMPFEMVNYCSDDYPMYILAIPSTVVTARRGYPKDVYFEELDTYTVDQEIALSRFCKEHGIEGSCKWYLSSYFG